MRDVLASLSLYPIGLLLAGRLEGELGNLANNAAREVKLAREDRIHVYLGKYWLYSSKREFQTPTAQIEIDDNPFPSYIVILYI